MTQSIMITRYLAQGLLMELLRELFPNQNFKVQIRNGQYIIEAPRLLTTDEIESCTQRNRIAR
ncbi:hypothetical protein MW887_002489 [Aspergillus wentii]|nr:hypothetical protein MW887_002489 [Aspergillus wentii]